MRSCLAALFVLVWGSGCGSETSGGGDDAAAGGGAGGAGSTEPRMTATPTIGSTSNGIMTITLHVSGNVRRVHIILGDEFGNENLYYGEGTVEMAEGSSIDVGVALGPALEPGYSFYPHVSVSEASESEPQAQPRFASYENDVMEDGTFPSPNYLMTVGTSSGQPSEPVDSGIPVAWFQL